MRALVAVAGLILIAGLVGAFLTFVIYFLAGLAALGLTIHGLAWVAEGFKGRRAGKRIRKAAESVAAKSATLEADRPEVVPEEMRHPAWKAALDERTADRERLARRYVDLRYRVVTTSAHLDYHQGYFDREAVLRKLRAEEIEVEALIQKVFGVRPRNIIQGVNNKIHGVDLAPPRDEVLHLRRRFSALTDCRYGHADTHNIVGIAGAAGVGKQIIDVPAGRIVRECAVCAPVTRWTENP